MEVAEVTTVEVEAPDPTALIIFIVAVVDCRIAGELRKRLSDLKNKMLCCTFAILWQCTQCTTNN